MKQFSLKKILYILIIPFSVWIILAISCVFSGTKLFLVPAHYLAFIKTVAVVLLTSFALSLNLNSGRFDFSLGSIALLSSIIATKITITYNLPVSIMLFIAVVTGLIEGMLSGGLYVLLKLQPIIVSLGVTLIYEAASHLITGGKGLSISTKTSLIGFANSIPALLIVIVISLLLMIFIQNKTLFAYDLRALQTGQRIAVDTGINEHKNAIVCYGISGALMGCVGFLNVSSQGSVQISMNFSSITAMFVAFLPMFIGGFLSRFCDERIGMLVGSVTYALLAQGFVRLGFSMQLQSLMNAVILLLFLIYINNEKQIYLFFKKNTLAKGH